MSPEEQFKLAEQRYWNDVDNFVDRWIVYPRPLEENRYIQTATRNNQIDFARALKQQEKQNTSTDASSQDIAPQDRLVIQTSGISKAITGYRGRSSRRKQWMLHHLVKVLPSTSSAADLPSRCLSHLAKIESPFFFDLPAPLSRKKVIEIYQKQREDGQEGEIEGLTILIQNLNSSDAEWFILNNLVFEKEWFLIVTDGTTPSNMTQLESEIYAVIGMLASRGASVFQHYIARGLVPQQTPALME